MPVTRMPAIYGNDNVQGQVDPAYRIYERIRDDPRQQRKGIVWDDVLASCAHAKCKAQAEGGWIGHVDPDGKGPNYWLRNFYNYPLPDWYSHADDANNVESLSRGGVGTIEQIWEGLLASELHRTHVLALHPFFAEQTHVGVGYYFLESSESKHYWAIISCPPESRG